MKIYDMHIHSLETGEVDQKKLLGDLNSIGISGGCVLSKKSPNDGSGFYW